MGLAPEAGRDGQGGDECAGGDDPVAVVATWAAARCGRGWGGLSEL
jgi:hypothetical protein